EMLLENDEIDVRNGAIREMIHEQVDPHPRRSPEYRRQPVRDHIFLFQPGQRGAALGTPIDQDGFEWAVLCAERVAGPDAVAAVRIGIYHELRRRSQLC